MDQSEALEQGRGFYFRCAWTDAYKAFVGADQGQALGPEDLELLAT